MKRFARIRTLAGRLALRWSRDLVALVGVACVALGLSTVSVALAWIAVGGFLLFASGSGRARAG